LPHLAEPKNLKPLKEGPNTQKFGKHCIFSLVLPEITKITPEKIFGSFVEINPLCVFKLLLSKKMLPVVLLAEKNIVC
jgi:hypothetical protein